MAPRNTNNRIAVAIGALLALTVSLPVEWMTIRNARIQLGSGFEQFGNFVSSAMGQVTVNGANGHITLLVKLPIWLVVIVGLAGVVLALLNGLRVTTFPKYVPLIPLTISALYVLSAFYTAASSDQVSIGLGPFLATLGLVLGYLAARPSPTAPAAGTD